ncbi:MAG: hypothetical protein ABI623_12825, partial [bacterium]
MNRFILPFVLITAASLGFAQQDRAPMGTMLSASYASLPENEGIPVWVFFKDKGANESLKSSVPLNVVSQRSIQRRLKVR